MASGRIGLGGVGRIAALALACGLAPASAAGERSSPEDLRRFVAVTRGLEQAPLKPDARADRQWAMGWLLEAPDVTVIVCTRTTLGGTAGIDYEYAGEVVLQDSFATAAFVIEHPEAANDQIAQHVAGVEGALAAYRSILKDKPDARSATLDALLQTQARGGLSDHVRQALARCSAENE